MADRIKLLKTYANLSNTERFIMQLLAIVYEPASKTSVVKILRECDLQRGVERPSSQAAIGALMTNLKKLQLIDNNLVVNPLLVETVTRHAIEEGHFAIIVRVVQKLLPLSNFSDYYFYSALRCERDIRIALYFGDLAKLEKLLEKGYEQYADHFNEADPLLTICNDPFELKWFKQLPIEIQHRALDKMTLDTIVNYTDYQPYLTLLHKYQASKKPLADELRTMLLRILFCQLETKEASLLIEAYSPEYQNHAETARGCLAFLTRNNEQALNHFHKALALLKQQTRKKKVLLEPFAGLLYLLALLRAPNPEAYEAALDYVDITTRKKYSSLHTAYQCLKAAALIKLHKISEATSLIQSQAHLIPTPLSVLFSTFVFFWINPNEARSQLTKIEALCNDALQKNLTWFALLATELLLHMDPDNTQYQDNLKAIGRKDIFSDVIDLVDKEPPWQRSLNALRRIDVDTAEQQPAEPLRLAWFLEPKSLSLTQREQKLTTQGTWSKGRGIAFNKLTGLDNRPAYLTEQDQNIIAALESGQTMKALQALVGHPHLFLEDSNIAIEFLQNQPELIVEKDQHDIHMHLSAAIPKENIKLIRETPTRYRLLQITKEHRKIADILGEDGLVAPKQAKKQIVDTLATIAKHITIHSEIGDAHSALKKLTSDSRLHIHLLPLGGNFKVELFVRPFTNIGPYFKPGVGGCNVIAEIHGDRQQTRRDLNKEREEAEVILDACPSLAGIGEITGELLLEEPEDCLNVLLELRELGDRIIVEWPEGKKIRISHFMSADNLYLNIHRENNWFELQGEMRLDDKKILNLHEILTLMQNRHNSRFIPLGEGQFIALTESLRKQLQDVDTFSHITDDKIQFHPLTSLALESLTQDARHVQSDQAFKDQLKQIAQLDELTPKVPSTFQTTLREYQLEGYHWLMRLAHWGVGACLADDMGLGKTIQTLALLLARADQGPSLVVAPTSVCMNWKDEAERFAPTLNLISLRSKEIQSVISDLKPFDIVIASYGLMQQHIDTLNDITWNVIVLDEAQAIKNIGTKRSKAATSLQAKFKLLTTGTPIENHLGELWNLFNFINPGLLGTLNEFQDKFSVPIEKFHDHAAKHNLKKLIQPFILRRLKVNVLEELPPRTEIVLHVEMDEDETVFYEALRRQALASIDKNKNVKQANRIKVLAEITKLRLACCNPKLVEPEIALSSAKLSVFVDTLKELLECNHKALIFSQFVKHLHLIKEALDREKITYQYLDGSVPPAERKKRVDSFQAGEGDVFLISLKAGGSGLNLTAADYVIHMDPWWNPAVEDQASDRAHRIGQQRPVTIYRLIVKDSIEEKIMKLHTHKRDLATSLLEGSDVSGKISLDDLLELLEK